jgi:hypothetical protein
MAGDTHLVKVVAGATTPDSQIKERLVDIGSSCTAGDTGRAVV